MTGNPAACAQPMAEAPPPAAAADHAEGYDLAASRAKIARIDMHPDTSFLNAEERQVVNLLIEAAELPKAWPTTYLAPRDWKGRLVASRTLELTWESEPPAGVAMPSYRDRMSEEELTLVAEFCHVAQTFPGGR